MWRNSMKASNYASYITYTYPSTSRRNSFNATYAVGKIACEHTTHMKEILLWPKKMVLSNYGYFLSSLSYQPTDTKLRFITFMAGKLTHPCCLGIRTHTHTHTNTHTHVRTHAYTYKTHIYIYIYIYLSLSLWILFKKFTDDIGLFTTFLFIFNSHPKYSLKIQYRPLPFRSYIVTHCVIHLNGVDFPEWTGALSGWWSLSICLFPTIRLRCSQKYCSFSTRPYTSCMRTCCLSICEIVTHVHDVL